MTTCGAGDVPVPVSVSVSVSTSSITTATSTRSHVHMLKINGYSAGKVAMRTGSHATSCNFEAAGHTWNILYYPNGFDAKSADHVSLQLRLDIANLSSDDVVNATFRFSLVPHHSGGGGGAGAGAGAEGKKKQPPKPTSCIMMSKPKPPPPPEPAYDGQSIFGAFRRFSPTRSVSCFVRREVLEKSEYLLDDSFAVRCDIDVLHTSAVSDRTVDPHDLFRLSLSSST